MALLRKDLKIGFLAGALLLVLGAGYALFATLGAPDDAVAAGNGAADPLATASSNAETASGALGGDGRTTGDATSPDVANDEWAGVLGDRPPVVTQLPQAGDAIDAPPSANRANLEPQIPDINGQFPAGPGAGGPTINPAGPGNAGSAAAGGATTGATTGAGAATTHVIESGENFSTLAQKYYGDGALFDVIAKANPSVDSRRLKIGQRLNIPELADAQKAAAQLPPAAPATDAGPTAPAAAGAEYTVAAGDTLSSIAEKRLGRRALWKDIYELNRSAIGSDPAALKVGMKLKMPR